VAVVHGLRWTGPIAHAGDGRLSQVPGEPICMHAPLFDPYAFTGGREEWALAKPGEIGLTPTERAAERIH
jgi:hypothetical protein